MKTELKDTGERMIPELHKGKNVYGAHIGRYQAGAEITEGKVVLDIACGSGYGTYLMAKKAKKVYGVDIDEQTIEYAKENYSGNNIEYIVGDGVSIPLKDKSVDIVVSYETIEHIEKYDIFMKEVKRVLKDGGLFLLSTPNDVEYGEGNHYHIHEFTYQELQDLVKQYFKFHKDYFQTLWLYSSILPLDMQKSEWTKNVRTSSTIALNPEQSIYFFLICSDREIYESMSASGVIGEHYRQRDQQEANTKRIAVINQLQTEKKQEIKNREQLKVLLEDVRAKYKQALNDINTLKKEGHNKSSLNINNAEKIIKSPKIIVKKIKRKKT